MRKWREARYLESIKEEKGMEHPYLKHYSVKENDIILDLGATQGDFLQEILPQVKEKNAHVFCVEPEPYNISKLSEFIFHNALEHATLIAGVTGSCDGMDAIVVTDQAVLHHNVGVEQQRWGYKQNGIYQCPSCTLSSLLASTRKPFAFVKCDIEGAELETFLEGSPLIYSSIDSLAIAAYHVRDGHRTHEKLVPFFESCGYKVEADLFPEFDNRDMVYAWRE